jgi:hypothetical protein
MRWPLSHHIWQQNKLHFHTPQSIPWPIMIWNWDLTSRPTYYELDMNQKLSKIIGWVWLTSQALVVYSYLRGGTPHQTC